MKIHIKGGTLIDPVAGTEQQADVFVADGKIAALGTAAPAGFNADNTIDAAGMIVAPGLVDLCARLRGSATSTRRRSRPRWPRLSRVVSRPSCARRIPTPCSTSRASSRCSFRARNLHQANVHPLGALTVGLKGEVITEMVALTESGCVGFTHANVPVRDTQVLLRALQYASTYGYTTWLRPQDAFIGRGGVAASGALASRLGLSGVPVAAETIALHTIFELMRVTGARVHLARLSSAAGLALVREAKAEGLPVTCDVGVNHLHLIDVDIGYFDSQFRLDPPLRSERDREAIRVALADGTIDAICSDHTPDDDEKLLPFGEATPGATELELLLSLTLKWADETRTPLAQALRRITSAPADVLKLPAGRLTEGGAADLCVFDPRAHWRVEPRALKSQGHNSPFLGYELPATVRATLVAGQVAFERH